MDSVRFSSVTGRSACVRLFAICAASAGFPVISVSTSSLSPSPMQLTSTPAFASCIFILSVSVTIVSTSVPPSENPSLPIPTQSFVVAEFPANSISFFIKVASSAPACAITSAIVPFPSSAGFPYVTCVVFLSFTKKSEATSVPAAVPSTFPLISIPSFWVTSKIPDFSILIAFMPPHPLLFLPSSLLIFMSVKTGKNFRRFTQFLPKKGRHL